MFLQSYSNKFSGFYLDLNFFNHTMKYNLDIKNKNKILCKKFGLSTLDISTKVFISLKNVTEE